MVRCRVCLSLELFRQRVVNPFLFIRAQFVGLRSSLVEAESVSLFKRFQVLGCVGKLVGVTCSGLHLGVLGVNVVLSFRWVGEARFRVLGVVILLILLAVRAGWRFLSVR